MSANQALESYGEVTGNSYEGESLHGRPHGQGKYEFGNGTIYEGEFRDAMFHGKGTLFFPGKGRYEATWEKGKAVEGTYIYGDGLVFSEDNWDYCQDSDRRFYSERLDGIRPAGQSKMTNDGKLRDLPDNCIDLGDGFYNPDDDLVHLWDRDTSTDLDKTKTREVFEEERELMQEALFRVGGAEKPKE